jgi:exodeoxyribonuclease VII small subunit
MTAAEQLPFPDAGQGVGQEVGRLEALTSLSFETLMARLETNISLLADGTAPLDELVAAHQLAAGLLAEAERRLESLKARADQLVIALKT